MTFEEYQTAARRTHNPALNLYQTREHAKAGLCAEAGEVLNLYQKALQGHPFDEAELKLELGDVMWMVAEFCDCYGWTIEEVAEANIEKLKKRYPRRFSPAQSIHRKEPGPGSRYYARGEGHRRK